MSPTPIGRRLVLRGKVALAALLALGSLGACIAPAAPAPRALRILAYNVRHGAGMDDVVDLERTARVINALAPDLVALQEIDEVCGRTGGVDQARRLGELCGMHPVFGPFMDYDGGRYGMALLARDPWLATANHVLPPGTEPRSALAGRVRLDGDGPELVIVGMHLYETEVERAAQARRVLELYAEETAPVLLVGDFNSTRGSTVMQLFEPSFTNPPKDGPANTWPADAPDREIDFILLRPAERFEDVRVWVVDERVASDHRPVVLDAVLR